MFQNFQAWKLRSVEDYLVFILVILAGVLIFKFFINRIYRQRNDANALKIVKKRLKYREREAKAYHDVTLSLGGQELHYDHLIVDAAGIVAIRSIGWGIKVYGQSDQPTWKVADNKTEAVIPNPVAQLAGTFEALRSALAAKGIYNLTIDPLVVFADPFTTPELYLGRDSCCLPFAELKSWKKQRKLRAENKSHKLDVAKTAAAIEEFIKR